MVTLPNLATLKVKVGDTTNAILLFLEAEQLAMSKNNNRSLALIYNNLGDLYLTGQNYDKAQTYIESSIRLKKEMGLLKGIESNYFNMGYIHAQKNEHRRAIDFYTKALTHANGAQKLANYKRLMGSYKAIGNTRKAFDYAEASLHMVDSLENITTTKNFNEIAQKYESVKKANTILKLEGEKQNLEIIRNRDRRMMFYIFGLMIITGIISYLLISNQKRKQVIINQEHELNQNELLDQMKKQELEVIERVINGQDEERNKIAANIHDSLGSKLSTLKRYIEKISSSELRSDELLNSALTLADQSYIEVRNIAHNINAGVLMDRGFVPALKDLAHNVAVANNIHVEVITTDLTEKIENRVEIQLFRIIQELFTNVIKHASAKEIIIQIINHDDHLNIIIEDDGIGFDLKNVKRGMGFRNIEKRISQLNGTYNIDSTDQSGTTIIINLPT